MNSVQSSVTSNQLEGKRPLPEGWVWRVVKDCGTVVTGTTPSKKDPANYGDYIPFVKPPELRNSSVYSAEDNLSERGAKSARVLPPSSVLVSCIGNLGKIGINRVPVAFNQQINSIIFAKEIMPEFGFYYFQSSEFKEFLEGISSATTVTIVNKSKFESLPFPLPPLPAQERIVARLEELLSDLEAGVTALERVRAGVKRYKVSVLKAACEGKLFGDKGIENGELPEGWRWAKIDEIADTIGGVTKGRNLTGKATIMLPYLRVANVQRGRLDLDVMKEIEILASEAEKYRLQDGDVVLTEGGDWDKLGRSAIWRNQIPNCIHQNHIFRARTKSSYVLPEWLMYYTNSEQGQNYFKEAAKQTTNLASINLTQLRACPIPLPPLEEQRRIVAEVELRLESARAVESAVKTGLKRAAWLRQAVLRSAFEGRLS